MATVGRTPASSGDDDQPRRIRDITLSDEERLDFLEQMARIYRAEADAGTVLALIRFPQNHLPVWQNINAVQWWTQVFFEFDNGILPAPYRNLLYAALRVYASNPVLRRIAVRHGVMGPEAGEAGQYDDVPIQVTETETEAGPEARAEAEADAAPEQPPPPREEATPTCHVIVRANSEEEREEVAGVLRAVGLDPHEVWSTSHAVSYRVNQQEPGEVRPLLDHTELGWTVVPPGQPDYLFHTLYVQGPDGRQWRFTDAPAQQTVADIGSEVIDQYPPNFGDHGRPIVVDKVAPDGTGQRLHGEDTLHDAGVQDGDQLRVGVEATAGALNPRDREDALFRAHNQILAYAAAHPGFTATPNSPLAPTEYVLTFTQASFGPGARLGDDPVRIDRHEVFVQLRADFPRTPPLVFWETPIFHPNVRPNYYDDDDDPGRGLVCLGALHESYQPSMDFGDLCQILVDMAAFRNYSVAVPTRNVDSSGRIEWNVDYFDPLAHQWVCRADAQARIEKMGGRRLVENQPRRRRTYRNIVEDAFEAEAEAEAEAGMEAPAAGDTGVAGNPR